MRCAFLVLPHLPAATLSCSILTDREADVYVSSWISVDPWSDYCYLHFHMMLLESGEGEAKQSEQVCQHLHKRARADCKGHAMYRENPFSGHDPTFLLPSRQDSGFSFLCQVPARASQGDLIFRTIINRLRGPGRS